MTRLRRRPRLGIVVSGGEGFVAGCREVALRLGIFKLVWIDPRGGLRGAAGNRHSFVHLDELRSLLDGEGEARSADEGGELTHLSAVLGSTSFCGLGQSVAWPIESALEHFGHEFTGGPDR